MKGMGWLGLVAGMAAAHAGPRRMTAEEREEALTKQKFSNTMRLIVDLEKDLEKCGPDKKRAERIRRKIEGYEKELAELKAALGFADELSPKQEGKP